MPQVVCSSSSRPARMFCFQKTAAGRLTLNPASYSLWTGCSRLIYDACLFGPLCYPREPKRVYLYWAKSPARCHLVLCPSIPLHITLVWKIIKLPTYLLLFL